MSDSFASSVNWLINSGIYNSDPQNKALYGSVNSYYDLKKRKYPFAYTEISGYYVSLMSFLSRQKVFTLPFSGEIVVERARKTADCIRENMRYQGDDTLAKGSLSSGYRYGEGWVECAYSFDCAMCANGFLDLYNVSKNDKYLQAAKQTLDWLVDTAIEDDGCPKPLYDWGLKKHIINQKLWFQVPGSLHLKMCIPLLRLGQTTGDDKYVDAAKRLISWSLHLQDKNGGFRLNDKYGRFVNMHAHCYALEGIVNAYSALKDEQYLGSFLRGVDFLCKAQKADGGFYEYMGSIGAGLLVNHKSSYVASQAMRLFFVASKFSSDVKYLRSVKEAQSFASDFICMNEDDAHAYGGLYQGDKFYGPLKMRLHFVNSWATMFFVSALAICNSKEENPNKVLGDIF